MVKDNLDNYGKYLSRWEVTLTNGDYVQVVAYTAHVTDYGVLKFCSKERGDGSRESPFRIPIVVSYAPGFWSRFEWMEVYDG